MSGIESRRLLGLLLLWASAPLPFLYIVLPPFWLVAIAVGLLLCLRPSWEIRLPVWALNLIALAIVGIVLAVGGLRVGPLRPLGHLLLLLTSVRVLPVRDLRGFLGALLPVFLVWIVAVTSSTHLAVVPYFAVSAAIWWWVGMRVRLAEAMAEPGLAEGFPRPRHAVVAASVALLLAAVVFVVMPRLRTPWIAGRGGVSSVTGFSSHVELGGVGTIRESPEVAMVVRSVDGLPLESRWMRLRAAALERVTLDSWAPRGANRVPRVDADGMIWPFGRRWPLDGSVELSIEVAQPRRYLFLPEGTIAFSSPVPVLLDPSNGVALASRVRGPLTYRVWVTRADVPRPSDPPPRSLPKFEPDPAVRRLARTVVEGYGTDVAKAAAIERYLQQNYRYAMSGMTHLRSDPIAWFLLHERAGHCEYFAGAMVAMLDDLGIPARMVAGYSGGDLSPGRDRAVVREANAHAWVEARVGHGNEWTSFDPTPAAEVPSLSRPSGRERLRWAVDSVQSAWDRYVLTFGFSEQMQLLGGIAGIVDALVRAWSWRLGALVLAGGFGVVALWAALKHGVPVRTWRRQASTPAARAVDVLARRLGRRGVAVPRSATVRWIVSQIELRWPDAGGPAGELGRLAERELYDIEGDTADRVRVRALRTAAQRAMKRLARAPLG